MTTMTEILELEKSTSLRKTHDKAIAVLLEMLFEAEKHAPADTVKALHQHLRDKTAVPTVVITHDGSKLEVMLLASKPGAFKSVPEIFALERALDEETDRRIQELKDRRRQPANDANATA